MRNVFQLHGFCFRCRIGVPSRPSFKETNMTKKILAVLLLSGSLMIAACNTVEGAGQDVQSAGQAVEDAAD